MTELSIISRLLKGNDTEKFVETVTVKDTERFLTQYLTKVRVMGGFSSEIMQTRTQRNHIAEVPKEKELSTYKCIPNNNIFQNKLVKGTNFHL